MLVANLQTQGRFKVEVDFEIENAITAIFGPSGSGKSTLLRAIAGLEPAKGLLRFNDATWLDSEHKLRVDPTLRPIGYVRQNVQLWPHLSVRGNLEFPLKHAKRSGNDIEFDQVVQDFELAYLLERRPHEVSGGESQRIALARALLAQPQLLLLDEPLTGLDLVRKAEILPYLEALNSHYKLPTLYVSHAIDEVLALCSATIVLGNGRVRASGATAEIIERQDISRLLADEESISLVRATILEHQKDYDLTTMQVEDSVWSVPMHVALNPGEQTMLRIRARDVALAKRRPEEISVRNVLEGEIKNLLPAENGPSADCILQNGATRLRARITRASLDQLDLKVGDRVFALIKSVTLD